jgi:Nif-specific regulatory protein
MSITDNIKSRESLAALVEASSAINSSLDASAVLQAVAENAARVAGAEAASVMLLDKRRNKLLFKAAIGHSAEAILGEEFNADLGIAGSVVTHKRAEIVHDVSESTEFFKGIDDKSEFQTKAIMAAPMVYQGELIGVIEVLNKAGGGNFSAGDLELLQVFGNLAASGTVNAEKHEELQRENLGLRESVKIGDRIIGSSKPLADMLKMCDRVAPSNATVLLLGETGTGKEMSARYVHQASPRRDRPFIAINCAALAETLLESELFGHEKGAFTGATTQKLGRFEMANNGTLFLDEIGDISSSIQVKLLRVLQEKELVRVGGSKTIACDVRIIAATNRDLKKAVEEETFREDLYYRLNVFPIQLPPLRQRREDIPELVEYFVEKSSADLGVAKPKVDADSMALLTQHDWPGNIRELQNVIERAVLMCDGAVVQADHLPREITGDALPPPASGGGESSLWDYERALIIKSLKDSNWNQSQASRALGISRDNLRYRIKKYNIEIDK